MNASFTCKTIELRRALLHMQPALPKNKKASLSYLCEVTVLDGKISLVIQGIEYTVFCKVTRGTCKFILTFVYFLQIVKDHKSDFFNAFVEPGLLRWGTSNAKEVKTTFFEDDSILRSIDLPINPNPLDFIEEAQKHTREELQFNNMDSTVLYYESKMKRDIAHVMHYLSPYGVTETELRALIEGKRKANKLI